MPDLLLTLYLLLFFPLQRLWRSVHPAPRKPPRAPLQSYWRQARFVLVLLAALGVVMWSGGHSAAELGLAFPATPAAAARGDRAGRHRLRRGAWLQESAVIRRLDRGLLRLHDRLCADGNLWWLIVLHAAASAPA